MVEVRRLAIRQGADDVSGVLQRHTGRYLETTHGGPKNDEVRPFQNNEALRLELGRLIIRQTAGYDLIGCERRAGNGSG